MKTILFRTGYMGLGAIEQLAFEIVTALAERYRVVLAIENEYNNSLVEKLPKNVEYFYLKDKKFLDFMKSCRERKSKPVYRLIYNFLLSYEKIICKNRINHWLKNNGGADLFVDYDGMALKYAKNINIDKKVVWQHTALSGEKHLGRMGNRLKNYDRIALICEEMKDGYIEAFPELKDKFVTKYNFLDIERIEKMMDDEAELTPEEKELQRDRYCVAVARLDEPKDFTTLIKAFEILKNRGIEEKLYIVGEGELRGKIEKQLKELELEERVILLGRKKNPYIWIKNSQMFLHSSKREGLGMVLLEAMACEKMVISSDCPVGPREVLENGKVGILYEVGNYRRLAEIIEEYLLFPEKRIKYIVEGKYQLMNFRKEKIIKEYFKFFDELMEK